MTLAPTRSDKWIKIIVFGAFESKPRVELFQN